MALRTEVAKPTVMRPREAGWPLLFPLVVCAVGCGDNAESPLATGAVAVENEDQTSAALPSLAMNERGTASVVWTQSDATNFEIWSNQYTPGTGWGVAEPIAGSSGLSPGGPQVAIDRDGNAVAVWDMSDGTRRGVWASSFAPDVGWTAAERLENAEAGDTSAPRLGMDGAGNVLATWSATSGTKTSIWVNQFEPGTGWQTAELIASSEAEALHASCIAVNASGDAELVYIASEGIARSAIFGARFTPETGWGEPTLIDSVDYGGGSPAVFSEPQVALAEDGTAHLLWITVSHPITDLKYAITSVDGEWGTPEFPSSDSGVQGAAQGALFLSSAGEALAAWTPSPFLNAVGGVLSRHYAVPAGWSATTLAQAEGSSSPRTPDLGGNAAGLFAAAWSRGDSESTVWLNHYDADSGWRTARNVAKVSRSDPMPRVAVDAAGNTLLVWLTGDEKHGDLVSQMFPAE